MKDFETLMQDHFGQLNTQELQILYSNFHEEKLNRNDFFTKSDNICDRLSIVKSGILRVYALSDRKEITQWISTKDFYLQK